MDYELPLLASIGHFGAIVDSKAMNHSYVSWLANPNTWLAWLTKMLPTRALGLLMVLAFVQGLTYALLIPLWQAPDEPMLFEYAALTAELGRIPHSLDRSASLESRILESMNQHQFWSFVVDQPPTVLPTTFEEAANIFWMPRQVAGDPPGYFALAGFALWIAPDKHIDAQVLLLRALNALLIPLIALCAYASARELTPAGAATTIPLAVTALVAFQPMFSVINSAIGNDSLANMVAALICWRWMRIVRTGASWREVLLLGALATAGLLIKRTLLPYALLLAASGLILVLRRLWQHSRYSRNAVLVGMVVALVGLPAWAYSQLDRGTAWGWYQWGSQQPAMVVQQAARPIVVVPEGQAVAYQLPAIAADHAKSAELRYGVEVWSDNNTLGRLAILNDDTRHEIRFAARQNPTSVDTTATIYPDTRGVVLVVEADRGTLYLGDAWARSGEATIMAHGGFATPMLVPNSPFQCVLDYLRLPDIFWALRNSPSSQWLPTNWWDLLFASFWGHFGWMNVPFVYQSTWMWIIGIFCAISLIGMPLMLIRYQTIQHQQFAVLSGLCVVSLVLPLINALAMPASQAIQQGRYLFPALLPMAILVATGQSMLVPARFQKLWLGCWMAGCGVFAFSALIHLIAYYQG
jgi:hypothetical protein